MLFVSDRELYRAPTESGKILQVPPLVDYGGLIDENRRLLDAPAVRFYGTPEAGWRALGVCLAYGLPILALRQVWYVLDSNEPTGPHWEVTFRERLD